MPRLPLILAALILAPLPTMALERPGGGHAHHAHDPLALANTHDPGSNREMAQVLAEARARLDAGKPLEALRQLPWHLEALPDELRAQALDIQAGSEAALGRTMDAIKTWHILYTARISPEHSAHARRSIQAMLRGLPPGDIRALKQRARNPATLHWLNDAQPDADHPERSFRRLTGPGSVKELPQGVYPEHVAVILPLSGRYGNLAEAVLRGVKASHRDLASSQRPQLSIYDMGEPPESAWQKYQEAVEAGAEIIIGPLTREAAAQFTERPSLPVPLLLLNQPGDDFTSTAQVIQFALKPEHETAQVAHLAYTRGHRRAAIMAPRSSLGDRLASAFNHQFTQQGGHVISVQHYAPAATDFQVLLRRILARNVDMLFLVASPEQARMIQPQLRYLHAGHLPVYATSHLFEVQNRHEQDPDLEGIIFPEMPAMLSRQGAQGDDRRLLHGNPAWPHLVAMGIDAFTLIPELDRLQRDPQATHTGLTGHLSLDSQGRLVREFDWAHFRNGRPAPLQAHQDGS
ncbi:hypothetical protein SAMN05444515_11016 [Ectothiorhodospira marina]|uniref:LppC lipoprotein n=2 Tax=Ectothiorhodospira marina TaxID=1396821 RepID=A0A1H7MQD3_9GAMM|nr:hypothetical protein SAMN05444515_11016 [Ectothiorhodospira marina]